MDTSEGSSSSSESALRGVGGSNCTIMEYCRSPRSSSKHFGLSHWAPSPSLGLRSSGSCSPGSVGPFAPPAPPVLAAPPAPRARPVAPPPLALFPSRLCSPALRAPPFPLPLPPWFPSSRPLAPPSRWPRALPGRPGNLCFYTDRPAPPARPVRPVVPVAPELPEFLGESSPPPRPLTATASAHHRSHRCHRRAKPK